MCVLCTRSCRQPQHSTTAGEHQNKAESNEPDPLYLAQVHTIPVIIFGEFLSPVPSSSTSRTEESCSVCLGEYMVGEEIRVLPKCNHMFHRGCIDCWLITRSPFCPICRDCVTDRSRAPKVFEIVWSIWRSQASKVNQLNNNKSKEVELGTSVAAPPTSLSPGLTVMIVMNVFYTACMSNFVTKQNIIEMKLHCNILLLFFLIFFSYKHVILERNREPRYKVSEISCLENTFRLEQVLISDS